MKNFRITYNDGTDLMISTLTSEEAFDLAIEHNPNALITDMTEVDVIKGIQDQHVPLTPIETVLVDLNVSDTERAMMDHVKEAINDNVNTALAVLVRAELALSLHDVLDKGTIDVSHTTVPEWYIQELDKIIRMFASILPHHIDILHSIQRTILTESPGI
jgi:hypothetical protein